jgi:hypothetical protein
MNDRLARSEGSAEASALIKLHGQLQRVARGEDAGNDQVADERGRWGKRLSTREPGQDGGAEAVRRATGAGETADDHNEERPVTAVVGLAIGAAGEMPAHGRGLFRGKLAIQIFPQSPGDLGTLH